MGLSLRKYQKRFDEIKNLIKINQGIINSFTKEIGRMRDEKERLKKEIEDKIQTFRDREIARKELSKLLGKIEERKSELLSLNNQIVKGQNTLDTYKSTYRQWEMRVKELQEWANNLARKERELIKMAISLGVYSPIWRKNLKVISPNKQKNEKSKENN